MQKFNLFFMIILAVLSLSMTACSIADDDCVEITAPVHMEIPTDDIQPRMGLAGFILGTILIVNAYLVMLAGVLLLVLRDKTAMMAETLRTSVKLVNPTINDKGWFFALLGRMGEDDTRTRIATGLLIGGLLVAYFGAWIAM